jgi:hypothetical protein
MTGQVFVHNTVPPMIATFFAGSLLLLLRKGLALLGVHSLFVMTSLLLASAYFLTLAFAFLVFRRTKFATVTPTSLIFHFGVPGFQKDLSFLWGDLEAADICDYDEMIYIRTQWWWGTFVPMECKALRLKFQSQIPTGQLEKIQHLSKSWIPIYPIEVNDEGRELYIKRAPKGGFGPLLSKIEKQL